MSRGAPSTPGWNAGQEAANERIRDLFPGVPVERRELIWSRWARRRGRRLASGAWRGEGYGPCSQLAALRAWEAAGRPDPQRWDPEPPAPEPEVWTSAELDEQDHRLDDRIAP